MAFWTQLAPWDRRGKLAQPHEGQRRIDQPEMRVHESLLNFENAKGVLFTTTQRKSRVEPKSTKVIIFGFKNKTHHHVSDINGFDLTYDIHFRIANGSPSVGT